MAKNLDKLQKKAIEQAAKGNYAKAAKLYQELYQENPDDIRVWLKIAEMFRKLGETAQAVEFYQKAAALYALQGRLMQSIGVNKIILEIDPRHKQTQEALAELYAQKESKDKPQPAKDEPTVSTLLTMLKRRGPILTKAEEQEEAEVSGPTLDTMAAAAGLPQTLYLDLPPRPIVAQDDDASSEIDAMLDLFEQVARKAMPGGRQSRDLPRMPLFSSLDQAQFVGIVERAQLRLFADGEQVIQEGDGGDAIYVIVSGQASVTKAGPRGETLHLAELHDGAFFGELSYFRGAPRTASVFAAGPLELLELSRQTIDGLIRQHPNVKRRLLYHYHERMLDTVLRVSPLFAALPQEQRDEVRRSLEYVEALSGDKLIEQGSVVDALYIVARGEVEPSSTTKDGGVLNYPMMSDGDFFGEIGLISGKNATATCIAVNPTALYRMSQETFKFWLDKSPVFAAAAKEAALVRSQRSKEMLAETRSQALTASGLI